MEISNKICSFEDLCEEYKKDIIQDEEFYFMNVQPNRILKMKAVIYGYTPQMLSELYKKNNMCISNLNSDEILIEKNCNLGRNVKIGNFYGEQILLNTNRIVKDRELFYTKEKAFWVRGEVEQDLFSNNDEKLRINIITSRETYLKYFDDDYPHNVIVNEVVAENNQIIRCINGLPGVDIFDFAKAYADVYRYYTIIIILIICSLCIIIIL